MMTSYGIARISFVFFFFFFVNWIAVKICRLENAVEVPHGSCYKNPFSGVVYTSTFSIVGENRSTQITGPREAMFLYIFFEEI